MRWQNRGFCMNEATRMRNQTEALERAFWEGSPGARGEIRGNIVLLEQLQQLLHALPYAHRGTALFLSVTHNPSTTEALAQPGAKVASS